MTTSSVNNPTTLFLRQNRTRLCSVRVKSAAKLLSGVVATVQTANKTAVKVLSWTGTLVTGTLVLDLMVVTSNPILVSCLVNFAK